MNPANKKTPVVLISVAVGAVALGFLIALIKGGIERKLAEGPPDVFRPDNPEALPTVQGGTREILQEEIAVPGFGATNTPEGVAVPTNVSELSGPGGEAGLRDFELKAEGGKFTPSTIVVNDGDIITVHLTAVDGDYNIFFPDFGVFQAVSQGQTVKRQFQATPFGQYEFFCKDCDNDAKGTLIVNEKL